MRVLTFSNLYPSAAQPRHGIFVEHRIRHVAATGKASIRVVAPVPWVPVDARPFGRFGALARVPRYEERDGIPIYRPRFPAIPRLSGWVNPLSMALFARKTISRLQRSGGDFDVIDAHFVYPDGAAAVLLGQWFHKPVIVTARGTDVNDFTGYRVPRAWIRWVGRHAAALVTVSSALRDRLIEATIPASKISVLRNGVDLDLFAPGDRDQLRRELGLGGTVLLSVGHLLQDKGHHLVIEALKSLRDTVLVIVGDGPAREELRDLAKRCAVERRVRWCGTLSQAGLACYYAAADATVLASRMEGMPNVLLESLACGTPVIASNVGGAAEIVTNPVAGILLDERTPAAIARACSRLMRAPPRCAEVRTHAERFGWEPTVQGLLQLFESTAACGRVDRISRDESGRALG